MPYLVKENCSSKNVVFKVVSKILVSLWGEESNPLFKAIFHTTFHGFQTFQILTRNYLVARILNF